MAKTIFAALDVGTTKTCGIIASAGDAGAFQVLGVGVSATRGLKKGVVINLDEAKSAIREAVKKAEHASGIKMESAYVGVTGKHISSLNTRSAVAVGRGDRLGGGGGPGRGRGVRRGGVMDLPRSELAARAPAGLVLTGGTANLPGIEVLGEDIFRLPVRVGAPQDVYGLADILYGPACATAVGLLKRG